MEKTLKKTPINPNNWNYSDSKDKEAEIKKAAETAIHLYDGEAGKERVADATIERLSQNIDGQSGSDRVPGKTNGPMKAVGKYAEAKRGQCFNNTGNLGMDDRWSKERRAEATARNKRSVWTVTTQPYSEAHFATFPPKLIEPCILAGTSEKGVCAACGAPWVRVVEKSGGIDRDRSIPEGLPDTMNGHGKHQLSGPKFAAHKALNPDIYLGNMQKL